MVIDFETAKKKKEHVIKGDLISPETITLMDNEKLIETMGDLTSMLNLSEDDDEKDVIADLMLDAINEVQHRLNK